MKALMIIDLQRDFCTEDSPLVSKAYKIMPAINELLSKFELIIFTKARYPEKNNMFETELHPDIDFGEIKKDFYIFKREYNYFVDFQSYGAFGDNIESYSKYKSELKDFLDERNVTEIFICGLDNEHSCKQTAIDSAMFGYKTTLISDATKFISEDNLETIKSLTEANVKIIESWELPLFNLIK